MKRVIQIGVGLAVLATFSSCRQLWNTEASQPETQAVVEVAKSSTEKMDSPVKEQNSTELISVPKLSELLVPYLTDLECELQG